MRLRLELPFGQLSAIPCQLGKCALRKKHETEQAEKGSPKCNRFRCLIDRVEMDNPGGRLPAAYDSDRDVCQVKG